MEDVIRNLLDFENLWTETDNVADLQLLARKNWETRAKRKWCFWNGNPGIILKENSLYINTTIGVAKL